MTEGTRKDYHSKQKCGIALADSFWFPALISDNRRPFPEMSVKQFEVSIEASKKTFIVNEGETVLTAALRQGVMLPYSCKNGTCGSCKGKVLSGEVHYPFHPPLALERSEIAEDVALMCQAEPMENLVVRVREIEAVRDIQVRMLPGPGNRENDPDGKRGPPPAEAPQGTAIAIPGGPIRRSAARGGKRRAFSIASCPSLEDEIELHIRHVEGGGFHRLRV